jgi:hypothetical protein
MGSWEQSDDARLVAAENGFRQKTIPASAAVPITIFGQARMSEKLKSLLQRRGPAIEQKLQTKSTGNGVVGTDLVPVVRVVTKHSLKVKWEAQGICEVRLPRSRVMSMTVVSRYIGRLEGTDGTADIESAVEFWFADNK